VTSKTALSLPLLSWTRERKYGERLEGQEKDSERSFTNYHHGQNRLNLGRRGSLIPQQSNQSRIVRNKTRSYNTFPPPLPSSRAQLHSCFSTSSPLLERCRGTGNGGYGQFITHHLCHSLSLRGKTPHTLPLLQHEGSSPGRQFSTNFSNMSSVHGLQLFTNCPRVGLSTGCSPSGTGCSSVGPPRGHKPCQQTCSGMSSSLPWATGPARSLLQHGAPHGITVSFGHPPALAWGSFHRLQVQICSTVDLHGLQGNNLPHHGLHHRLQGKALCSEISSTSSPLLLH